MMAKELDNAAKMADSWDGGQHFLQLSLPQKMLPQKFLYTHNSH